MFKRDAAIYLFNMKVVQKYTIMNEENKIYASIKTQQ